MTASSKTGDKAERRMHYSVLFTNTLKQWEVTEAIRRSLPDGTGDVFYPCVELWWHGVNRTKYKPLFPGYVFIRSCMDKVKVHDMIRSSGSRLLSFVKELYVSERRMNNEDAFSKPSDIIDLNDAEAEFFDLLLGFRFDEDLDRRREAAQKEGKLYIPTAPMENPMADKEQTILPAETEEAALEAELRRRSKGVPQKGVLQMSFGYKENGRIVVMDGPLRGNEGCIKNYKAKDQKAYLNVSIAGHPAKAGLAILGKRVWYPDDKDALPILSDGTEIDLGKLSARMNGSGVRKNTARQKEK